MRRKRPEFAGFVVAGIWTMLVVTAVSLRLDLRYSLRPDFLDGLSVFIAPVAAGTIAIFTRRLWLIWLALMVPLVTQLFVAVYHGGSGRTPYFTRVGIGVWWMGAILWVTVFGRILLEGIWRLTKCHTARLRGLCPHCGYDLRATPSRCPECGHDVTPVD